jgi:uncharacterized repeat protein (TIGR02059 family)
MHRSSVDILKAIGYFRIRRTGVSLMHVTQWPRRLAVLAVCVLLGTSSIVHADGPPQLLSFTSSPSTGAFTTSQSITITATFDEDLDPSSTMTITLDTGVSVTLNSVNNQTLSGIYTVAPGNASPNLTVDSIDSANVTDLNGNNSTSYSIPSGQNLGDNSSLVIETTPPTLSSATVIGTALTLTYSTALNTSSVPATADFTVNVNASPVTVDSVTMTGATIALTLAGSSVQPGDTVTLDYTPGGAPIEDLAANTASSLAGQAVTNNSAPPGLTSTTVSGALLTLTYTTDLDPTSLPATTDFVVTVNGSPAPVSSVSITNASVSLLLTTATLFDDTVTISYTPGSNPLRDLAGIYTTPLVNQPAINRLSFINGEGEPVFATAVGTKIYVQYHDSSNISVIDALTDSIIATIPVGTTSDYFVGSSVVGHKLYLSGLRDISVIDTNTDALIASIPIGTGNAEESTVVGTKVYVSEFDGSAVAVIDTITDTLVTTIHVPGGTYNSTAVGTKLYVNIYEAHDVTVIDTTTDTVVGSIPSGGEHEAQYGSSALGTRLYVDNINAGTVSVIDTTTDTVIDTIPVGVFPYYSLPFGNKLYISNRSDGTVSVVDLATDTVVGTLTIGAEPETILPVGSHLYVFSNDFVTVIDPQTDAVLGTIACPGLSAAIVGTKMYVPTPEGICVADASTNATFNFHVPHLLSLTSTSPDGTYVDGQSVNITARFDRALGTGSTMRLTLNTGAQIDLASVSGSTLVGTYTVGPGQSTPDLTVSSISTNPLFTSVSDTSSPPNTGSSFIAPAPPDLTGDASRNLGDLKNIVIAGPYCSIPVGVNPYQMATVGTITYVANQGSNTVSVLNDTTNTVSATISVGNQPYGVAYNAGSKEVYVSNLNDNTVSVIDADPGSGTFNTVTHTIAVGIEPYYVASLGTNIYVTNNISGTVSVVSTLTHAVTNTIAVGIAPRGIKPHGTDLYVANFGSTYGGQAQGTVSVIDSLTNTVTDTINVGSGARGVAVNGNEVYVANFNDNTVSVIDATTNTVTHTIAVGRAPRGMLSLGSNIYVENYDDGTLSVISTASHTVTGTYPVGNAPSGVVAVGTNIYVSRFTDGLVSMFDTASDTLKTDCSDVTPPTLSGTVVSGATLALTYAEALKTSALPAVSAYTVLVDGTASPVATVTATGSMVVLTLQSPVTDGQTVVVSYAVPGTNPLQDLPGNLAEALSGQAVTNDTPAPVVPPIVSGGGGGGGGAGGGSRESTLQSLISNVNHQVESSSVSTSAEGVIPSALASVLKGCAPLPPLEKPATENGQLLIHRAGGDIHFIDVPASSWFLPFIGDLATKGIVSGYTDANGKPTGEFAPVMPVNIAEVIKMAMQAFEKPATSTASPRNLSAQGSWVAPYVARAEALKLPFMTRAVNVNLPATRALAIEMFAEAARVDLSNVSTEDLYTDVPQNQSQALAIDQATRLCWIQGDTDPAGNPVGTFRPSDTLNRAEAAKILSTILARKSAATP